MSFDLVFALPGVVDKVDGSSVPSPSKSATRATISPEQCIAPDLPFTKSGEGVVQANVDFAHDVGDFVVTFPALFEVRE